jgi:hypothetical protein
MINNNLKKASISKNVLYLKSLQTSISKGSTTRQATARRAAVYPMSAAGTTEPANCISPTTQTQGQLARARQTIQSAPKI